MRQYVCSRVGRGGAFFALPVATPSNPLKTNNTEVTDGNDWGLDMVVLLDYVGSSTGDRRPQYE
jgi:hypothetical protein